MDSTNTETRTAHVGLVSGQFGTFAEAYPELVREVLKRGDLVPGVRDPSSVGSNFGTAERATRELIGSMFVIENPRSCMVRSSTRSPDVTYALGSLLWTLAGSDSPWIGYYNPRARAFQGQRGVLTSALGPRIVGAGENDQLDAVIRMLRDDPTTRRAQVVIARAEDLRSSPRDFPCPLALQFLIRRDRLIAVCTMRSQSALMVLPYDIFLMSSLQQIVAARLDVKLGPYVHACASLHVYEDEIDRARAFIDSDCRSVCTLPMPPDTELITRTLRSERALRTAAINGDAELIRSAAEQLTAPRDFWSEAQALLVYKAAMVLEVQNVGDEVRSLLRPEMRKLLDLRSG